MAEIKKINTQLQPIDKLLDTSGDAGTSGQILSTTGSGTNWIDDTGGSVTGTGVATRVTFWSDTTVLSSDADLYWDNTNKYLGIGTATPGSILHIAGTPGSVAGSGIFFSGNTAIWQASSSTLTIRPSGTDIATFTSTGVGIGATAPNAKLEVLADVAKGVLINRTYTTSSQSLANIRAYYGLAITPLRGGTGGLYFTNYDADTPIIQSVNTSDVAQSLLLNPLGGNVGIGTTTPSSTLHVYGDAVHGDYYAAFIENSGGGRVLKLYNSDWDATDYLIYATNGGTASIGYEYIVTGNAQIHLTSSDAYQEMAGGNGTPGTDSMLFGQNSTKVGYVWNRSSAATAHILFGTSGTERIRIAYNGVTTFNGGTTVTFNDHTTHTDQVKSYFGTGQDANIQHDNSHLYIDNSTGTTYLRNLASGGSGIIIRNSTIGDIQFDNEFAGNILFNTSNVTRLTIDSSGNATFAGNILIGNTVVNPASGFSDQTGIGLKYSTTVPQLEVSSDAIAVELGRTSTGGEGQILALRKAGTVIHSFSTNAISIGTDATFTERIILSQAAGSHNATPTIAFGDGDSGFYERFDDDIRVSIAGTGTWEFAANSFGGVNGGNAIFNNETATTTNPTVLPYRNDSDTGIGGDGSNTLSLIAGGVEALSLASTTATFAGALSGITTLSSTYAAIQSNINSSGTGGLTVHGNRLGFDQSGTRSWTMYTGSGNLNINSGDGNGILAIQMQVSSAATSASDGNTILTTKGYVDGLITGATIYQGTWDARTSAEGGSGAGGNPDLTAGSDGTSPKINGYYYVVSDAGSATPNGPSTTPNSWHVGDWVIWNDHTGSAEWQKIDNSSVLSGTGTGQTVALWQGTNAVTDSETLGNAPITFSTNDATFAGAIIQSMGNPYTKMIDTSGGGDDYGLNNNDSKFSIYNWTDEREELYFGGDGNATFTGNVDITGTNDLRIANGSLTSSQSSTTAPVARFTNTGVNDYNWTFPNNSTIQLGSSVGTDLILKLANAGAGDFNLDVGGDATFAGNILFATDGTYDIGSTAGSRPRDVVVANSIAINTSTGGAGTLNVASTGTFGGNVTIDSTGSAGYIADRANDTSGATYEYKTAGALKWYTGLRGLSNDDFYLFNNAASTNALIITASDSNATFAGNVGVAGSADSTYSLAVNSTDEDAVQIYNSTDGLDALITFQNPGGTLGRIQGLDNGGLGFDTGNNAGGMNSNALHLDNAGDATFAGEVTSTDDINALTKIVIGEGATPELRLKKTEAGTATVSYYSDNSQKFYQQLEADETMVHYAAAGTDQKFYAGASLNLTLSGTTATFAGDVTINGTLTAEGSGNNITYKWRTPSSTSWSGGVKNVKFGRIYWCPGHWTNGAVINITLQGSYYQGVERKYTVSAQYQDTDPIIQQLSVADTDNKIALKVGATTSAGYDYSGQPVYYADLNFVCNSYMVGWCIVESQMAFLTANPTSTWGGVVMDATLTEPDSSATYPDDYNLTFGGTVKASTYLVNLTTAVGIGTTLGDINGAELGPGYLTVSRDDTADAKQISFYKNNVEHSYLETTSSGLNIGGANVGIGTTSPGYKLEVAGSYKLGTNAYIEYGGVYPYTISVLNTAGAGNLIFNAGAGSSGYESKIELQGTNTAADDGITFTTGSSTAMVIQVNGNVGIGTTSPTVKLQIEGADDTSLLNLSLSGGYSKGSLEIDDPYFVVKSTSNTTGGIKFRTITGGTTYDRMTILNSGNVGIGTTNPAQNFVVANATNGQGVEIVPGTSGIIQSYDRGASAYVPLYLDTSLLGLRSTGHIEFKTGSGFSEAMRIDSSGNVGIGTTSPLANLDISNAAGTTYQQWSYDNPGANDYNLTLSETVTAGNVRFCFNQRNASTTYSDVLVFNQGQIGIGTDSPADKLDVSGAGGVGIRVSNSTYPAYYANLVLNLNDVSTMQLTCLGTSILQAGNTGNTVLASRTNKDIILSPSGTGNVGIGTTAPATLLSNTATRIGNADGLTTHLSGVNWEVNGQGYTAAFSNLSTVAAQHNAGVLVEIAGTDATDKILDLESGGVNRFRMLGTGNATFAGLLYGPDGSKAAPTYSFTSDTNTGMYSDAADRLSLVAGGNTTFEITATTIALNAAATFLSTATATNFILSSDETLKDNIKEIDTKHVDVNWKNFELKSEPGVKRSGVIAQELEKKHPEFVRTDDEGLKSVAYIDLLISKIAELEARLEKLEK